MILTKHLAQCFHLIYHTCQNTLIKCVQVTKSCNFTRQNAQTRFAWTYKYKVHANKVNHKASKARMNPCDYVQNVNKTLCKPHCVEVSILLDLLRV